MRQEFGSGPAVGSRKGQRGFSGVKQMKGGEMFSKMDGSSILCQREIKKNKDKRKIQPFGLFQRVNEKSPLEKRGLNERVEVEAVL